MKYISILNQKGGSGKTSFSVLVILALASQGKRVLAIDCDPQYGLSAILCPTEKVERLGLFELLSGMSKIDEVTMHVNRGGITFDLVPSDYRLDSIVTSLDPFALKRKFKGLKRYDYIVFDTPPTVQGISRAAAMISDEIYIPSDISIPSLGPTMYTLKSLEDIEKTGNVVLVGFHEPREDSKGYTDKITREFLSKLNGTFKGSIPRNVTMAKAIADPETKWTAKKKEAVLQPILDILEI